MVLFVPRRHPLRIRGGMAEGQWHSRPTILLAEQTKHLPRLLHSHGHTKQCFLLITLTNYLTKKLQSGKAASYEFVRKNKIMCAITEISQEMNLSLHHSPTSLSHEQKNTSCLSRRHQLINFISQLLFYQNKYIQQGLLEQRSDSGKLPVWS